MPLEIREIGIRMRVGESELAPARVVDEDHDERSRDAIVEDCVRRVMAILKTRQER
jgi:hypothetical protein